MFVPTGHESLTESIIGCGIRVHQHFGPGLLESVYCRAFAIELRESNLAFQVSRRIPLTYRGVDLGTAFQADLVVESQVIVEVKAVEQLAHVHSAQVITYLKLTGCPVGLIMNFNVPFLRQGIRRLVHPDIYPRRSGQNKT
jgi:GxxExxY protein